MFYRVKANVTINNIRLYYQNKFTYTIKEKTFSNLVLCGIEKFVIANDKLTAKMLTRSDFQKIMSSNVLETLRAFTDVFSWNTVRPKWYQELIECDYNVNEDFEFDWDTRECTIDEIATQFEFSDVVKELENMNISIICPKIEK